MEEESEVLQGWKLKEILERIFFFPVLSFLENKQNVYFQQSRNVS